MAIFSYEAVEEFYFLVSIRKSPNYDTNKFETDCWHTFFKESDFQFNYFEILKTLKQIYVHNYSYFVVFSKV